MKSKIFPQRLKPIEPVDVTSERGSNPIAGIALVPKGEADVSGMPGNFGDDCGRGDLDRWFSGGGSQEDS